MILRALQKENMKKILEERAKIPETLRTPMELTYEQQLDWYEKEICNIDSKTRYFGLYEQVYESKLMPSEIIGIGGIEHIDWVYSIGEISILIYEEYRMKGYGEKAVEIVLDKAFNFFNLNCVWGEVYQSSFATEFWKKMIFKYKAFSCELPNRKYYLGRYWPSIYFSFDKDTFNKIIRGEK